MKIGVVPTIREVYKDQYEFSIDLRLYSFLRKIYDNCSFKVLSNKEKINFDLLCLSGGNDIYNKTTRSVIRKKLDNYYYKEAKRKKIPILGICHGAQFIAHAEGCKVEYKKQNIKPHKIYSKKINYLNTKVNSYHNLIIKSLSSKCEPIANDKNYNIECFKVRKSKILGIIWHPERYKNFKKIDIKLIRKFL